MGGTGCAGYGTGNGSAAGAGRNRAGVRRTAAPCKRGTMGRESECECECSGTRGRVKALLEPPDLILRGEIRRRIPFAGLTQIRADGECLHFNAGGETFTLALGNAMAQKWVKALT